MIPLSEIKNEICRRDFSEYRNIISKNLKTNWFVNDLNKNLNDFVDDLIQGKKPSLIVQTPPQHGKSSAIVELMSWVIGRLPDAKIIYTAFSDRLSVRANNKLQKILQSEVYKEIFPHINISIKRGDGVLLNNEIIEIKNYDGFFRNTTVGGAITGETLSLGVIDDPLKGREAANSITIRNKIWDWFTDDFFTRFLEDAGLICILTRWHIDDPIGRLIKSDPSIKVLSYPAIATQDEEFRKEGEPLFPELKSLEFLLKRKALMSSLNWEALYQQNPMIPEGNIIKRSQIKFYKELPIVDSITISCDFSFGDSKTASFAVCQVWGKKGGEFYLIDQLRDRMDFPTTITAFKSLIAKYPHINAKLIEAKANGQAIIDSLKKEISGIIPIRPMESKESRLNAVAPMFEAGNVYVPENANWIKDFVEEVVGFPNYGSDDQVDALSQYLNWVRSKSDTSNLSLISLTKKSIWHH